MNAALRLILLTLCLPMAATAQHSVARLWNEVLLHAMRNDFARPTVHARNLFHTSIAMYDAWAAYDGVASTFLLGKKVGEFRCAFEGVDAPADLQAAREEAISYAAYRLLTHRFRDSPGVAEALPRFDILLQSFGYDPSFTATDYQSGSPAALGNYIAQCLIEFGLQDGANERNGYASRFYEPVNPPMFPALRGNRHIVDPNRWQPLVVKEFIDQTSVVYAGQQPDFLSPEWGGVTHFALSRDDLTIYERDGQEYWLYHDPGPPLYAAMDGEGPLEQEYRWGHTLSLIWSSHLDPTDGVTVDISPASLGNVDVDDLPRTTAGLRDFYDRLEGGDPSTGRDLNPRTGESYELQRVPRGDYARVITEYWVDGPNGETPPGHWFTILNDVGDHPLFEKKLRDRGPVLDDLEWDVIAYFALGGALHDAAVAAWGIKGWYDYIRPICAIRWMAEEGQSTDADLPSFSPDGLPLIDGLIEVIQEGDPLAAIAGDPNFDVGKIKVRAWRGPNFIEDPKTDAAGVGWILAGAWWTYQAANLVTPPFAGYVSDVSAFSRAAAEVLTLLTGDAFFPGGMGEFHAVRNDFLELEDGPSVDVNLQWATYRDAADQASLSTFWAGIHTPVDDIQGRLLGERVGIDAFHHAEGYFAGRPTTVEETASRSLPAEVVLSQNYPNPFNSSTVIRFALPKPEEIELIVYNLGGQRVATLAQGRRAAGTWSVLWDGRNDSGAELASGSYLYRLRAGELSEQRKLLLLR